MNEEKPGILQFFRYLAEKRSLWLIAAGLVLGVLLMLSGGKPEAAAVSAEAALPPDASALEAQLRRLCARAIGSDDVIVAITLDTYGEQRYAADRQTLTDGERVEERTDYVTVSQGLIPTAGVAPTVRGAAIVCARGDDPAVKLRLTELACALLGIPAHAVCVSGTAGAS